MIWHSESVAAVLTQLGTDRDNGLTDDDAAQRLREYGPNMPKAPKGQPFGRRLFDRLRRPAVILLLILILVSLLLNAYAVYRHRAAEWLTPCLLLGLLVIRCLLDTLADRKGGYVPPMLHTLRSPAAHVWRGGEKRDISAAELVPGDIVEVTAGDIVPADCRLLSSLELHCDESPLTEDVLPAVKSADAAVAAIATLNHRENMLYAGCPVLQGHGRAVVVETGSRTARTQQRWSRWDDPAFYPQQQELVKMGKTLAAVTVIAGVLAAILSVVAGAPLLSSLLLGAALAASLMPEELATLAPMTWITGLRRMARHGLVAAGARTAEKLGQVDVLLADKTGLFTQNTMTLVRAFANGRMIKLDSNRTPEDLHTLLQLAALCADGAHDPAASAVTDYLNAHDVDTADLVASYPRVEGAGSGRDRRHVLSIHLIEGQYIAVARGAAEDLLPLCSHLPEELDDVREFMNAEALRTYAVAYKTIPAIPSPFLPEEIERDMTFLGLLGLSDPPYEDTAAAVAACRTAGICPIMITDDSPEAAISSARRVDLLTDRSQAITGEELAALSDEELAHRLSSIRVCARAGAADKLRLVQAWKARGAVVAVTGRVAADVPAMHVADVGCAAAEGEEHAADAAALVLAEPRFSALVAAIREARAIREDLDRAVAFRLAAGVGTLLLALLSLIVWGATPLASVPLLWTGLIGALTALIFAHEPAGHNTMRRPPHGAHHGVLGAATAAAISAGVLLAVLALIAMGLRGETASLAVWGFGLALLMLGVRSALPFWRSGLFRAPWAVVGLVLMAALMLPLLLAPAVLLLFEDCLVFVLILLAVFWLLTQGGKILFTILSHRR